MRLLFIALLAILAIPRLSAGALTLPPFFVENHRQAPAEVRFIARSADLTAYFSPDEAVFRGRGAQVRVRFAGANPKLRIEGANQLPGRVNFLTGSEDQWRIGTALYGAVAYRNLYPGIDMIYGANDRSLKSEFILAPGAGPSAIRLQYMDAGEVRIAQDGSLIVTVNGEEFHEAAPVIYQKRHGERIGIDGSFQLAGDNSVTFSVEAYDSSLPLVIDPVLSYSTLLGGSGADSAAAVAVDASGAAYVTGYTESLDFPVTSYTQGLNAGGNDVFVAKLSPSGNGLAYCTYLGGRGDDRATGIAVDSSGSAYITGWTQSTNFPVHNALQPKLAGSRNAFIAKLNAAGNGLLYSTYLGGIASDSGYGIALDSSGNAYVVGDTTSVNFPSTGFQRTYRGAQDAFVVKLSADGSRLLYSTYAGGANIDHGAGIAVDASGSAYITGSTYSADFPLANAFQSINGGGQDAFVTRLSADGASLLFSTYLGGSGGTPAYAEGGQAIALDTQGNAYITGMTSSPNFPVLNPLQSTLNGWMDAFVSKFNPAGMLQYSTFLGGSGMDYGNAIAVDAAGNAYAAGYTYSTDLPVVNALQAANAGDSDGFVTRVSATGNSLLYSSYLGGNGSDAVTSIVLDSQGNPFIAGWTLSTNFPLLNAYQLTNAGNFGAFVIRTPANRTYRLPASCRP